MSINEKIESIVKKNNSLLCVGLDSDADRLPAGVSQLDFNKAIIDATHDLVCAYKPNTAFYEALGAPGIEVLKATCDYLKEKHPEIPVIIDAKRADIGNTNNGYVQFAFDYLQADMITVHPYLGQEALQPFLDQSDRGIIVLCRTSNPGAGEFQDLTTSGKELYKVVAEKVATSWNANNNCLLVVGATYPGELAEIRQITGDNVWFLIPGIGAQGGDVEKTVTAGTNGNGTGTIISSSRDIIFASSGVDFAEAARKRAVETRDLINLYRKESK